MRTGIYPLLLFHPLAGLCSLESTSPLYPDPSSANASNDTTSIVPDPTLQYGQEPFLLPVPEFLSPPSSESASAPLMMAYYPDWAGPDWPPKRIDFRRFDWIDFAFAIPTQDFQLSWDDPSGAPELLQQLVTLAHAKKTKVKLSIGGWTGSKYFSSAVSTDKNRRKFVKSIVSTYSEFKLNGVDLDWEYPGHQGEGSNQVSPKDSANFLLFLQLLRSSLPHTAVVTAAVLLTPFYDASRQPMKNVAQFADVLDWVLLMNYDIWGSSSDPGPNAPLSDTCGNSTQADENAEGAIKAWIKAGFPASKLVLGVPAYGYLSQSQATSLRTRDDSGTVQLTGDGDQIQFRDLLAQGALLLNAEKRDFLGGGGFTKFWDQCSSTPFLQSSSANQVVSFDDCQSLRLKGNLVQQKGLRGANLFDLHGDTDGWHLTDAVREGMDLLRVH